MKLYELSTKRWIISATKQVREHVSRLVEPNSFDARLVRKEERPELANTVLLSQGHRRGGASNAETGFAGWRIQR